jgi:hypothetical protein
MANAIFCAARPKHRIMTRKCEDLRLAQDDKTAELSTGKIPFEKDFN